MNFIENDPSIVVGLIFGLAFIIEGLIQLFTGKILNYSTYAKKYTPESIERFIRPSGLPTAGLGLFMLLSDLAMEGGPLPDVLRWPLVGGMVVCLAIYLVMYKKFLVKK